MTRLHQPRHVDQSTLVETRELLRIHAEKRRDIKQNGDRLTAMFYKQGIPVNEIAEAYEMTPRAVYAMIERLPECSHGTLPAGDACTTCGEVAP